MARAILKFDDKEMPIGEAQTSFGRTSENTVSFPDNSNISRHHADIEFKGGRFVLTDLGSSNGTTINGQPIEGETVLNDGDFITLGNSVIVEFIVEDATPDDAEDEEMAESSSIPEAIPASESSKSKFPVILGVTGAVCGLAVVFAVAAALVYVSGSGTSGCDAQARILSPTQGEVIFQETEVKIDVVNSACVGTVRLTLNGQTIAEMNVAPYTAQIDPKNYPELADGGLYNLRVELEDAQGNLLPQTREVAVQIETKEITKPSVTPTPAGTTPTPVIASGKQPTLIDVQKMSAAVVGKFTGGSFKYNLSNQEFLTEVRKRTAEYSSSEGYFTRASQYRDVINQSFVRDKALDASLPYLLAMSRSKFNLDRQSGEGLWQMSNDFATANAYNVVCGESANLSDATQDCAAKVAALYMEDLVVKTFDGDIVLAVAAFGKSAQEALTWKQNLPAERSDFWKAIADPAQREQVARFFAAAIVAENPQRFGLKKDRPVSELYPTVAR